MSGIIGINHNRTGTVGSFGHLSVVGKYADSATRGLASFFAPDVAETDHTHIRVGVSSDANDFGSFGFRKMSGATDYAYMSCNNDSTHFAIMPDGKVGIGIVAPVGALHVRESTAGSLATVEIDGDNGSGDGGGQVRLRYDGTTYAHFRIRNDTVIGTARSVIIGDSNLSHGVYMNQDTSGWTGFGSDERRKTDWTIFEDALEKINTLTKIGTYYNMHPTTKEKTSPDLPQVGVSAQEVQAILPEAVDENTFEHLKSEEYPEGKFLSLRYEAVFTLAIKAIQELSAKNDALEVENTALKTRMDALEVRVLALESA